MAKVLWGGRFTQELDDDAVALSYATDVDMRLIFEDIEVNKVHCKALEKAGFLTKQELKKLVTCLESLPDKLNSKMFDQDEVDEDVHACVERLVVKELGDLGKKMHTGKSRNDQVATDMRLYLKHEIVEISTLLEQLMSVIVSFSERHLTQPFPGFTHLQIAQPILLSHHFLAYFEKFNRDHQRLIDNFVQTDECPLGSAALAGSNYPLDRHFMAKALGFAKPCRNSMDAVSDRDYMLVFLSNAAICMVHLSQFCEELILWSSPVLGWIEIGDAFTTGSSIMPQKKNPDIAELIRGKTGPILGHFVALHEMIKALPLTYNRDLQEDKPLVFRTGDTLKLVLKCFSKMLATITVHSSAIESAMQKGHILATEIADYLALKGIPFRDAHEITGKIVKFVIQANRTLMSLDLKEFQKFSPAFDKDILKILTIEKAIQRKNIYGGTASNQVKSQLASLKKEYSWLNKP